MSCNPCSIMELDGMSMRPAKEARNEIGANPSCRFQA